MPQDGFNAIKNNKILYENSSSAFDILDAPFSGSNLKETDYLQQICKSCYSKNNKIIYYDNHSGLITNLHYPHRSDLCAKCISGSPCNRVI